jgi:hypothetical protein
MQSTWDQPTVEIIKDLISNKNPDFEAVRNEYEFKNLTANTTDAPTTLTVTPKAGSNMTGDVAVTYNRLRFADQLQDSEVLAKYNHVYPGGTLDENSTVAELLPQINAWSHIQFTLDEIDRAYLQTTTYPQQWLLYVYLKTDNLVLRPDAYDAELGTPEIMLSCWFLQPFIVSDIISNPILTGVDLPTS